MDNIHLHSNQTQKGILKEDINKETDLEYRKSLPYDAMGDYGVIGSEWIFPSSYLEEDDFPTIPSKEELHPEIHKLLNNKDLAALLELEPDNSWSCVAEKNYYWTFGG